jgi:hypothetical protein
MGANIAATTAPVATGTGNVQALAASGGRRLLGYSVRESAGTAAVATAVLRHGTGTGDPMIAVIELAANGSETRDFFDRGIAVDNGVFVHRVAGETELALWWARA